MEILPEDHLRCADAHLPALALPAAHHPGRRIAPTGTGQRVVHGMRHRSPPRGYRTLVLLPQQRVHGWHRHHCRHRQQIQEHEPGCRADDLRCRHHQLMLLRVRRSRHGAPGTEGGLRFLCTHHLKLHTRLRHQPTAAVSAVHDLLTQLLQDCRCAQRDG